MIIRTTSSANWTCCCRCRSAVSSYRCCTLCHLNLLPIVFLACLYSFHNWLLYKKLRKHYLLQTIIFLNNLRFTNLLKMYLFLTNRIYIQLVLNIYPINNPTTQDTSFNKILYSVNTVYFFQSNNNTEI